MLMIILDPDTQPKIKFHAMLLYCTEIKIGTIFQTFIHWVMKKPHFQAATVDDFVSDALSLVGVANILSHLLGAGIDPKIMEDFSVLKFLKDRFSVLSRLKDGDDKLTNFISTLKGFMLTLKECATTGSLAIVRSRFFTL